MQQDKIIASTPLPVVQLYAGALAVSVGGALGFGGLFGLRQGLGDPALPVMGMTLLAVLPVWLSAWAIARFAGDPIRAAAAGMVSLFIGMALPVLGLWTGPAVIALALGAVLFCGFRGLLVLRGSMAGGWRGLALMALVTGGLVLLLSVPLRLFMAEAAMLGIASSDNYWHLAIMQMIARYHTISIGGDGLVHQNYHFLFHMIVAGSAKVLQAEIPLLFGYWSALTEKLQLVWALYCAGLLLFRTSSIQVNGAWWRLSYAWIATCLVAGYENESFILGNAFLAAYAPLIVTLLRTARDGRENFSALLAACGGIFVLATAKTSAGYYGAIGLFLLMWTHRANWRSLAAIGVTLALLAAYTEIFLIPKELVISAAGVSILALSYISYFERGVTLHYLLPAMVFLLYLWRPRGAIAAEANGWTASLRSTPTGTGANLPRWLRAGRGPLLPLRWLAQIDVNAQYVLLLLLGTLFVLLTVPIGDNIWDFSGILFGLSLLFLPMALSETIGVTLTDRPMKWLIGILLGVKLFGATALFAFNGTESFPQALVSLYRAASGSADNAPSGAKQDLALSLKTTGQPMARLGARIQETDMARLKAELARQNAAASGNFAVHIPPAADEVWRFFQSASPAKWCLYPHLWVPAVTGTAEIRSVPPRAIQEICAPPGITWYGYGKHQELHRTGDFSDEQLCRMALPLNARRVYRLASYRDLSRNSVAVCR